MNRDGSRDRKENVVMKKKKLWKIELHGESNIFKEIGVEYL